MKKLLPFLAIFCLLFSSNARAEPWSDVEFYGNGSGHKLSDLKGNVVLLMFWATWCPHCKNQMPALSMLKRLYSAAPDFKVLAVSTDSGGEQVVQNYLKTYQLDNLESYIDPGSNLLRSMGFSAIPTVVIISREGDMLGYYRGLQHIDVKYLEELIKQD